MIASLAAAAIADTPAFCRDHVLFAIGGRTPTESRAVSTPEELVGKVRFSQAKTVVMVIHGGLVSAASAIETAQYIHPTLAEKSYPIYVAWETGPAFSLFPPAPPSRRSKRGHREWTPADPRAVYPLGRGERRLERSTRGLAKPMWSQIKRFAADANDPANPEAAMNRFMRAFAPLWAERKIRLVLVGHSAGANFILQMLDAMDQWRKHAKVEVVFLAPACTYSSVEYRTRARVFREHVSGFRMFALTDEAERLDALLAVKAAPQRVRGWYDASMLYYVSNNLESYVDTPILGMQRFWSLAKREPVVMPRDLSADEQWIIRNVGSALDLSANTVWSNGERSISPHPSRPGWECTATQHVGFWSDPAMQRSLRAIVASPMTPIRSGQTGASASFGSDAAALD